MGDHDDLYEPDALFECVKRINAEESWVDIIYTDEDKVTEDGSHFCMPHAKPGFNIDLLRSCNYICHIFIFSRSIYEKTGDFDSRFDGSQDYDYILRATEKAGNIVHIPRVLYHWRMVEGSTAAISSAKTYAYDAGKRALEAHYDRMGIKARVTVDEKYHSYDTTYLIEGNPTVKYVTSPEESVDGDEEYIMFLNPALKPLSPDAVQKMIGICQRPDVGAVGGKILDKSGRIVHAGIMIRDDGSPEYLYRGLKDLDGSIPFFRTMMNYDCDAVSSECMLVRREVFEQIRDNNTLSKDNYSDLDFCKEVTNNLYSIVYYGKASFI